MYRKYFFVILLAAVSFFVNNTSLPVDIMEARNMVTAREMAEDGNWLIPTMNGDLRLEKPPLPTWVAAAVETAVPDCLAAQRIAPGIMGTVWTIFFFLLVRTISKDEDLALLSVMVFLTCYQVVLMGRTATWDIYCHAFMTGAIYFITKGLTDDTGRKWIWFPSAGVMLGLSFLSKGPVAFYAMLLPMLITSTAMPGFSFRGKWDAVIVMILLCAVTGGWWYAWIFAFHSNETAAVIDKETGAWTGHNVRRWWYYWRFFAETGIWAVLTLATLAIFYWKKTIRNARPYLFSVTWMVTALILLSLLPEKKMRYLLPLMVPCSMCTASLLMHMRTGTDRASRILFRANGMLSAVVIASLPAILYVSGIITGMRFGVLCILFVMLACLILREVNRRNVMRFAALIGCVFMLMECLLLGGIGELFGNPERHSIHETRNMKATSGMKMFHSSQESLRIELVYEAGRKILPLDLTDRKVVEEHLPFVLVSKADVRDVMSEDVLNNVDTARIGSFDDNKHPRGNKLYTGDFINNITVIRKKTRHEQDKEL